MSHDANRDRIVDELLRREVARDAPTTACVDADLLAAWHERSLPDDEAAGVEAHVASCARCRAALATLVRLAPAPAAGTWDSVRHGFRAGWLIPLATAAAIGVVAVALWQPLADAPGDQVVEMAANQPAVDEMTGRVAPAEPPADTGTATAPAPSPPPPPDAATLAAAPAAATVQSTGEPAPAVLAESQADLGAAPPADPAAPLGRAAPAIAAAPRASGEADIPARQAFRLQAVDETVFTSPDGATAWRLSAGQVFRDAAGGGAPTVSGTAPAWVPVALPEGMSVTAGHAPAVDVCWLVGPSGAVLRLTDGEAFERLSGPTLEDLTAVEADDALAAVITDAAGRSYRTTDGGTTWTPED